MPGGKSRGISKEEGLLGAVGREIGQSAGRSINGQQSQRGRFVLGRHKLPGNAVCHRISRRRNAAERDRHQPKIISHAREFPRDSFVMRKSLFSNHLLSN